MNHENFPIKRIFSGHEEMKVTTRKYADMFRLLRGEFEEIDPQHRSTVLDLQGLIPGSSEEDFVKWIEIGIGLKLSEISPQGYEDLNKAYQQGKYFLQDTLKYKEKEVNIGPEKISSNKDIFELLKKTVLAGNTYKALLYCRIVKATVVAYEALKNDALLLKEDTIAFEDSLISPPYSGKETPLVLLKENEQGKRFYVVDNGGIKGTLISRGKDIDKVMLRFITRPESSAEIALKDGIASRITIEKEAGEELVPILCEWLIEKMKVNSLNIENQDYSSLEDSKKIEEILLSFIPRDKLKFSNLNAKNITSMGEFNAFKITGKIKFLEKENNSEKNSNTKQFEIQLVMPDNNNENGGMNHDIYDVVKFVVARTRFDGACSESSFEEFVKDASFKSGMSEKKIKFYLLETKNAPIVKIRKKNKNNENDKGKKWIYIAHNVYSRWNKMGWVDSSLYSDIEYAKEKNKK